jgi:putative ubiquitin-RnfH superfamily antitoxin RatB of RatAB toxin-antitoxin module
MRVTVTYALPGSVWEQALEVESGATLRDAVGRSGVLDRFPALRAKDLSAGVFGKLRKLDDPLHEGDRVEIYRPLAIDPKEARRVRAEIRRRAVAAASNRAERNRR